ncbi:LysR family transcriptional regulator [Nonomuraea sp. M3C6]|uniref:LysR family transcriptional regulator n=1 Tax=Nonomuraea marmarensis TaxID=3351344 RepID=A0ABW7AZ19_9ACTN
MLDVKRLILLRDLADYGTVTAVADLHQVTPSAVSQQLRALEAETGAELLHREGRTVRLTAAGLALAAECEHVLAALERAGSTVRAVSNEVSGELLVGCFPSGLEEIAAPLAATLSRTYPHLRPRIIESEPDEALTQLKRRELDLAIVYRYHHLGTAIPAGLTSRVLFDEPIALAVPEKMRHAVDRQGVGALRHHPWIITPEPSDCRDVLLHMCHSAGFSPRMDHSYRDLRSAIFLVATGLGATILPMMMCRNPPAGVAILPFPGPGRAVEAVIRTGTDTNPAIIAATACLQQMTTSAAASAENSVPQPDRQFSRPLEIDS